jgi:hypothetical protein
LENRLTAAAIAVAVIGFVALRRGEALIGSSAGAATHNPGVVALPVPVTTIVKQAIPIYLDYSARTESIRNIPSRPRSPVISDSSTSRMAPTSRRAISFTRSIHATSRRRWIKRRRRRNATR